MGAERNDRRAVTLAFLGCGRMAERHSAVLRAHPHVARHYASRDATRARAMNAAMRGAGALASYDAALADERITCAVVVTPPATHLPLVLDALAAGKDVVVEKPAFLHSHDAETVAAAARAAGRMVLVAENYHYKPLAVLLRDVTRSGVLGDVRFVHVNALKRQSIPGWRNDPAMAGGGALFEGGVHWVHFMANLGLTVERVRGWSAPRHAPEEPERSTLVHFDYAGGAVGILAHSWEVPAPFGGLCLSGIQGTAGTVHFESNGLGVLVRAGSTRLRFPGLRDIVGFRAMWRDFVSSLASRREAQMTLAHARDDLMMIEAATGTATTPSVR